jgi:hypothetical protein
VANLADYAAVRPLVADVMSESADATVKDTIRETVEAVRELTAATLDGSVTGARVKTKLGLDKGSTSRRIKAALKAGYLRNRSPKGNVQELVLGDPMPGDEAILPTIEQVDEATYAWLDEVAS